MQSDRNALGGRVRIRLQLEIVVPHASDILLASSYPAWSLSFHAPDEQCFLIPQIFI
jgi:hypothetical protein